MSATKASATALDAIAIVQVSAPGRQMGNQALADNLPLNASLPEPDLDLCLQYEASAKVMLHRAWDNPDDLGEDSAICKEATTLLTIVRSHCSPQSQEGQSTDARTAFLKALKLTWLAVWRARDYSVRALRRRAQANAWEQNPSGVYHASDVRSFEKVDWFAHHYPLYDRDGKAVDRSGVSFQHRHHFQRIPQYFEGVMISAGDQVPNNHAIHLKWALIRSPLHQRQSSMALDSCLVEAATNGVGAQRSALPSHKGTIWLTPASLTGFSAEDLSALRGCRFEEGVTLTGDGTGSVAMDDIESGPELKLLNYPINGTLDLSSARGVRRLTLEGSNIHRGLMLGGDWPISLQASQDSQTVIGEIAANNKSSISLALRNVTITGDADFQGCSFDDLSLFRVDFSKIAIFSKARVAAGSICNFENCIFRQSALFDRCSFGDFTSFDRTMFLGPTQFTSSAFAKSASFFGTAFSGSTIFGSNTEPSTVFEKDVDLSSSGHAETGDQFQEIQFRRVEFRGEVKIRNRRFSNDTWFDNAIFGRPPSFHGSEFHSMTSFGDVKFNWKRNRPASTFDRAALARWALWRGKPPPARVAADNILLAKTADCFRVMTSMARKIDSPELAHLFHIEELRARHHRAPGGGVGGRKLSAVGFMAGSLATATASSNRWPGCSQHSSPSHSSTAHLYPTMSKRATQLSPHQSPCSSDRLPLWTPILGVSQRQTNLLNATHNCLDKVYSHLAALLIT